MISGSNFSNISPGSDKKRIQKVVAEELAKQPEIQLPNGKTYEDLIAVVKLAREQAQPPSVQDAAAFFEIGMAEGDALLSRGISCSSLSIF